MARLHSELILGLTDKVSGPARRIDQNLERMRQQQMRNQAMFDKHRNAMLGTAAAAFLVGRALATPVQSSVAFSTQLEDIRQKADLSSEAMERMGRAARDIGLDTAQGAGTITGAIDSMIGSGAVSPEQAQEIATPLGKASTAYTADPTEMANATSAMVLQLGLAANEMEKAYDIMAVGGKMGSFELKDMASQFPGVLADAKSLGIEGEKGLASVVAWLQIARRGTADASTAANNMSNFMGKILSPNAIKNFGEAGVDIVNEMKRATEEGVDPIEHAVGIINGLTEGQRDKLGELFADKQVTDFLLQATNGIEDYRKIRDEALAADGTVEKDFQARLETPGGAIARFEASVENLNIAIGNSLVPALTRFAKSVTPMIDGVASFVDANGELVAAVVEITAALIGLRLLAAAGGMAGALFGMGGKGPGAGAFGMGGAGAGGAAGGGAGTSGKGAPFWAFMGFNALDAFGQMSSFGTSIKENGLAAVIAERDARDKAANDFLLNMDIGGFKPFGALQSAQDFMNPTTGVGGGYTGASSGQIEAMKAEIAKLDAEIAEWPEEGMEERRARLAETLAGMEAELAASGANVTTQFGSMMDQLRVMAAQGVSIPITMGGPNLGAVAPPVGPRIGAQAPASNTTNVGNVSVVVQNPTNANPQQIGRVVGQQVADRVNASRTNGGMS